MVYSPSLAERCGVVGDDLQDAGLLKNNSAIEDRVTGEGVVLLLVVADADLDFPSGDGMADSGLRECEVVRRRRAHAGEAGVLEMVCAEPHLRTADGQAGKRLGIDVVRRSELGEGLQT